MKVTHLKLWVQQDLNSIFEEPVEPYLEETLAFPPNLGFLSFQQIMSSF